MEVKSEKESELEDEEQKRLDALPEEEKLKIDEVFSVFAQPEEDLVSTDKLGIILRALKQNPTESEIQEFLNKYDSTRRGFLEKRDLYLIMETKLRDTDTLEELLEAFNIFDEDNDGKLSNQEFRYAMTKMGDCLPEEEVDDMIKSADTENEGYITIAKFAQFLMLDKK